MAHAGTATDTQLPAPAKTLGPVVELALNSSASFGVALASSPPRASGFILRVVSTPFPTLMVVLSSYWYGVAGKYLPFSRGSRRDIRLKTGLHKSARMCLICVGVAASQALHVVFACNSRRLIAFSTAPCPWYALQDTMLIVSVSGMVQCRCQALC